MNDVTIGAGPTSADDSVALERILGFAARFDDPHMDLACHAAFPLALTPDLVYRIWATFVPHAPWTAVADVLLSNLCREVGYELYEMTPSVRRQLLADLRANEWFGSRRLDELAGFLLEWVRQRMSADDQDVHSLAALQTWTALAYTRPSLAARQLAEALARTMDRSGAEQLHLAAVVNTLAEPLAEFGPLLAYARGVTQFARGDPPGAARTLEPLVDDEQRVHVAGVVLPWPAGLEHPAESSAAVAEPVPEVESATVSPRPRAGVEVTVWTRAPIITATDLAGFESMNALLPRMRSYVSPAQLRHAEPGHPDELGRVQARAREFGLDVVAVDEALGEYRLAGDATAISAAAQAAPDGLFRAIFYPPDTGRATTTRARRARSSPAETDDVSVNPRQLARLYGFPDELDGRGECIGSIQLGGGFRAADLARYFRTMDVPMPQIATVSVDGEQNRTSPDNADGQVVSDIEIAGAVAPAARLAVYFAPNTDQGFLDAITAALFDPVNRPSVIAIGWGATESNWTIQAVQAFDRIFQVAAALGVTICCAAGDRGSSDGADDGRAHVDFPASSPYVLACGGTSLTSSGTGGFSEVVWSHPQDPTQGATGGGISDVFALPAWQGAAGVPPSANPDKRVGRGVPDVVAHADPLRGYAVYLNGAWARMGGTSLSTPLWAGFIARLNQSLKARCGFLNPVLYTNSAVRDTFRPITSGSNGAYTAGPGWNPCAGLGSPNGARLLAALSGERDPIRRK